MCNCPVKREPLCSEMGILHELLPVRQGQKKLTEDCKLLRIVSRSPTSRKHAKNKTRKGTAKKDEINTFKEAL